MTSRDIWSRDMDCDIWSRDMDCGKQNGKKNVNDMGEKYIEENIWTNKGEWTVEN